MDSYSDKESWNDVIIACSPLAAKWKQLSGFLGLSFETIKEIKQDNPGDSDGSWNDALMQWILRDYDTKKHGLPSWKTLLKTISIVDQPLFEKLAKEHQVRGIICICTMTVMYLKDVRCLYTEVVYSLVPMEAPLNFS